MQLSHYLILFTKKTGKAVLFQICIIAVEPIEKVHTKNKTFAMTSPQNRTGKKNIL